MKLLNFLITIPYVLCFLLSLFLMSVGIFLDLRLGNWFSVIASLGFILVLFSILYILLIILKSNNLFIFDPNTTDFLSLLFSLIVFIIFLSLVLQIIFTGGISYDGQFIIVSYKLSIA